MSRKSVRGVVLADVIVVAVIVGVTACLLLGPQGCDISAERRIRASARQTACKNNLSQLGKALQQYLSGPGGDRYFPYPTQDRGYIQPNDTTLAKHTGFSGASFLAALYWSGVMTEPKVYICPSTTDDNGNGRWLGKNPNGEFNPPGWSPVFEKPNGTHVSYASRAQWCMPRGMPLSDRLPSDTIIASDDTQGEPNHDDGFCTLYADMHVEFYQTQKVGSGNKGMVSNDAPLDMVDN